MSSCDRLLFPISDTQGRVVGFSGRAIHPENDIHVKYLVTPIYTKGELRIIIIAS